MFTLLFWLRLFQENLTHPLSTLCKIPHKKIQRSLWEETLVSCVILLLSCEIPHAEGEGGEGVHSGSFRYLSFLDVDAWCVSERQWVSTLHSEVYLMLGSPRLFKDDFSRFSKLFQDSMDGISCDFSIFAAFLNKGIYWFSALRDFSLDFSRLSGTTFLRQFPVFSEASKISDWH